MMKLLFGVATLVQSQRSIPEVKDTPYSPNFVEVDGQQVVILDVLPNGVEGGPEIPADCEVWTNGCVDFDVVNGEIVENLYMYKLAETCNYSKCMPYCKKFTDSGKPAQNCDSWFDGCNSCFFGGQKQSFHSTKTLDNFELPPTADINHAGCTMMFCMDLEQPKCRSYKQCEITQTELDLLTAKEVIPEVKDTPYSPNFVEVDGNQVVILDVLPNGVEGGPEVPADCEVWTNGCVDFNVVNGEIVENLYMYKMDETCNYSKCLPYCKKFTDNGKPAQNCKSWFDGCNSCFFGGQKQSFHSTKTLDNFELPPTADLNQAGCTEMFCFDLAQPVCTSYKECAVTKEELGLLKGTPDVNETPAIIIN